MDIQRRAINQQNKKKNKIINLNSEVKQKIQFVRQCCRSFAAFLVFIMKSKHIGHITKLYGDICYCTEMVK